MIKKTGLTLIFLTLFVLVLNTASALPSFTNAWNSSPSYKNQNTTFNITATESTNNLTNLTFWWNETGTWQEKQTLSNISQLSYNMSLNLNISTRVRGQSFDWHVIACNMTNCNSSYNYTVTVSNTNPLITSTAKTTATQYRQYSYDVDSTDVDSDTLTYSLTTYPAGMSISSSSGLITWTPNSTGNYNTTVIATDGYYNATQSFNITVSEGSRLLISKVDVKVDGKSDKDIDDEDTISKEAKPESDVEFKIEVENLYTDDDDISIEDITVTVTIRDIDDGDDLEEESKEFDLNPEKDKTTTINFEIPLEVDEDTYEVEIKVEGEDENSTEHEETFTAYLEVEKKNHEIIVNSVYLSPAEISCDRTIRLETSIINTGNSDEDDVSLRIENTALKINKLVEEIELDEGTSDNTYDSSYTFNIADDVSAGTYSISIKTFYDSRSSGDDSVELNVKDCVVEKEVEEEQKVTVTKQDDTATDAISKPTTKTAFKETTPYLMLLALLNITLIAILASAIYLFKTKR